MSQRWDVRVDWSAGLGLARTDVDGRPLVVLRGDSSSRARLALVSGRSFTDLPELLEAADGDPAAISAGEPVDAPDDVLLPPVGRPRKVICVGLNYPAHTQEKRGGETSYPALFPKWDNSFSPPYAEIPLPPESGQIDFPLRQDQVRQD